MRHARREMRENLITIARIATGGHMFVLTQNEHAPGRTYHQLARRIRHETPADCARDRSPAMSRAQTIGTTPGSTYPEIARRSRLEILKRNARDRSPATERVQPTCRSPGSTYSNSLAGIGTQPTRPPPARGAANLLPQTMRLPPPLTIH